MNAAPAALRAVAVTLAFVAAGCAQGASAAPKRHTVEIRGFTYEPAELTVALGDTVVWTNRDLVPHTATAEGVWDSGGIAAEQSWSMIAGEPGRHAYVCSFHPAMVGTLVVE